MSFAKSTTGRLGDPHNSLLDTENAPPPDFINSRRGGKRATKPEPTRPESKRVMNTSELNKVTPAAAAPVTRQGKRERDRDHQVTDEAEPVSKRPSPHPEPSAGQRAKQAAPSKATRSKDPPAKQAAPEAEATQAAAPMPAAAKALAKQKAKPAARPATVPAPAGYSVPNLMDAPVPVAHLDRSMPNLMHAPVPTL
eukprot:scaffold58004_cov54-Phaeocystis_antarctica.AAC.2